MKRFDFSKKHNICFVCFCVVMLFASILCFSLPVVHAEDNQPTPIIPSGYGSITDFISASDWLNNQYTLQNCNPDNEDLSSYILDVMDESNHLFSEEMIDGDLSNGEFIYKIDNFYTSLNGYSPIYGDNNVITGWTQESIPVDFSNYFIGYDGVGTFTLTCVSDVEEFDTTKSSNGISTFFGFMTPKAENSNRLNSLAIYYTTKLKGYDNVYVFQSNSNSFNYPEFFKYGDYPGENMLAIPGQQIFFNSSYRVHFLNSLTERDTNNNGYLELQLPSRATQGVPFTSEIYGSPHLDFNPISNGSNEPSDSDILDNDYLGDNNYILMNASNLSNGQFNVYLDTNSNQQNNKSNYSVVGTFQLLVSSQFLNTTDYSDIAIDTYGLTINENDKYFINDTFTATKSVPLNGNMYTFTLPTLNDISKDSSGKTVIPIVNLINIERTNNDVQSGTNTFLNGLFNGSYAGFKIPVFKAGGLSLSLDGCSYAVSIDIIDNNSNQSILKFPLSKTFDLVTGQSSDLVNPGVSQDRVNQVINDNNDNKDPSDPDYKDPNGYKPNTPTDNSSNNTNNNQNNNSNNSTGGSSSATAYIDKDAVNIHIENNPNIENNVSSNSNSESSMGSGFLSLLIQSIANNKSSSVDEIESISGVNGWLTVIQGTYSFIPVQVWEALSTAFIACIGILVVAFIISIVIKFIT